MGSNWVKEEDGGGFVLVWSGEKVSIELSVGLEKVVMSGGRIQ